MLRVGTGYFPSLPDAVRYYARQGVDAHSVRTRLREGEIHIGRPPCKPGERVVFDHGERRYCIEAVEDDYGAAARDIILAEAVRRLRAGLGGASYHDLMALTRLPLNGVRRNVRVLRERGLIEPDTTRATTASLVRRP